MRGAFVIKVIEERQPLAVDLTGWVEEVDTGKECRFGSSEEMVRFILRCLSELRDETS
jgi:hypothetical protein